MLLILFFDLGDLKRVVCEQDSVLLVQTVLQVITVEDRLELSQKFE